MGNELTRQSNFELLRIISMFMIVLHHMMYHGVMQGFKGNQFYSLWQSGPELNKFFSIFYFPGGEVGIALFFMISGYFLIKSDSIRIKKILLPTFFYSVFTVVLYFIVSFGTKFLCFRNPYDYMDRLEVSKEVLFNILAPLRSEQFWFVSAYILLIIAKPVYNIFLNRLNKNGFIVFLTFLFVFGMLFSRCYNLVWGYTQAFFYYALGAYLKKYIQVDMIRKKIVLALAVVLWCLYVIVRYEWQNMALDGLLGSACEMFVCLYPSCVCVALISIALFVFFIKIDMGCSRVVNILASTTFGVYLLHEGFFTRVILWDVIVGVHSNLYEQPYFPLIAPIVALAVFLGCSLIELFRMHTFKPVEKKIDILLDKIEQNMFVEGKNA